MQGKNVKTQHALRQYLLQTENTSHAQPAAMLDAPMIHGAPRGQRCPKRWNQARVGRVGAWYLPPLPQQKSIARSHNPQEDRICLNFPGRNRSTTSRIVAIRHMPSYHRCAQSHACYMVYDSCICMYVMDANTHMPLRHHAMQCACSCMRTLLLGHRSMQLVSDYQLVWCKVAPEPLDAPGLSSLDMGPLRCPQPLLLDGDGMIQANHLACKLPALSLHGHLGSHRAEGDHHRARYLLPCAFWAEFPYPADAHDCVPASQKRVQAEHLLLQLLRCLVLLFRQPPDENR